MSQYFPKPFNSHFGDSIKVRIDLFNYATKADVHFDTSHFDTSSFALKTNLASLKTEVDNMCIDVVKNDVVKNKLVAKVDNIDTSDFASKTKYNIDKTKLENKIADISNLAIKTALTTVENKIPDISSLVKKTDCNNKVTEIENKLNDHNHDKYITTPEFNKLAAAVFNARLAQANLITKTDFDAKLSSLNRKIANNKSKHLLVQNELNKLKKFDSSYFIGKSHFEQDGTQNYLVFQPMSKCFRLNGNTLSILSWQSKGLSNKNIDPPNTNFPLLINYVGNKIRVIFTGSCLKESNKVSYTHKKVANVYIVYELEASTSNINDPKLYSYFN